MNYSAKNLKILTIISAITTSVMGILFHFAYDFLGQNKIAGLFFPINESTWEHLKLLYFPMLISIIVGSFFIFPKKSSYESNKSAASCNGQSCYIVGLASGIYAGCIAIIVLFYTLNGIFGKTPDWLNITIYFVSVIIAHICFYDYAVKPLDNTYEYHNRKNNQKCSNCAGIPVWLAIFAITALCVLFFVFTIYTPEIGIFKAPS